MAMGVQESDVWAAADALLTAGEQPTIERVRLHLGRGSPNTVGPHLKAWFRTLGDRLGGATAATTTAPDNVTAAAQQFWELALAAAKAEWQHAIAQERQILSLAQEALAADRQSLQAEQQRLAQRETDLKAAIYSAREQAATAQEHAKSLEGQLAQSESRFAAMEARLVESANRERALQGKMEDTLRHHREALTTAEQRHATHERRWMTDLDAQRQATKKLQDELEQAHKLAGIQQDKHQRVMDDIAQARRSLESSLNSAKQDLKHAELRGLKLDQIRATLEKELATEQTNAVSLQQQLQARVGELNQRIAEQGTQLHIKDQQLTAQAHAMSQLQAQWVATMQAAAPPAAQTLPPDKD